MSSLMRLRLYGEESQGGKRERVGLTCVSHDADLQPVVPARKERLCPLLAILNLQLVWQAQQCATCKGPDYRRRHLGPRMRTSVTRRKPARNIATTEAYDL
jgi:hypothetical protein